PAAAERTGSQFSAAARPVAIVARQDALDLVTAIVFGFRWHRRRCFLSGLPGRPGHLTDGKHVSRIVFNTDIDGLGNGSEDRTLDVFLPVVRGWCCRAVASGGGLVPGRCRGWRLIGQWTGLRRLVPDVGNRRCRRPLEAMSKAGGGFVRRCRRRLLPYG